MIKNFRRWARVAAWAVAGLVVGCRHEAKGPTPWQGVIEYEDRILAFELPGRILAVSVDAGDVVDGGDEIARLDDTLESVSRDSRRAEAQAVQSQLELLEAGSRPEDISELRASVAAAKASEGLAKQTVERERRIVGQGAGSKASLDQAQTAYTTAAAQRRELQAKLRQAVHGARPQEIDAAQARVDSAKAAVRLSDERIQRYVLRADAPGEVLEVHVEPGEFAQVGTPIATLGDVHHPYVDVFVPQADIAQAVLGGQVQVNVDSHDQPYAAVVEHIGRRTEFTPRFLFSERERANLVIRVRVRIDAPQGDLHAGVPAFVTPVHG